MTQASYTLDLVNDFFRFVTGFFEVISTSAPHIYHSALLLSPKTSSLQKLYGPQVTFMTRVIKGIPTSWDPSIANTRCLNKVEVATWSPCGKLIAVAYLESSVVAILDATTLEQQCTLHSKNPRTTWGGLRFSPDSCLLTGYKNWGGCIMTWDLQTGGPISYITSGQLCDSVTHSECGTMLAGYFTDMFFLDSNNIIIYDILYETQIFSHSVTGCITGDIWTHNGHLQYTIVNPRSITMWEVSFTSGHAPIQVCTLSTPENFPEEVPRVLVFLPTLSLLAFTLPGKIFVWDAYDQKILLDSSVAKIDGSISFSPGGQFFIYETGYSDFCLYKKSPDGYLPHQKLVPRVGCTLLLTSPNGGSIISSSGLALQLWHTDSLPSLQSIPSPAQQIRNAYLEFLPDVSSVAIVESSIVIAGSSEVVTILDLKSGNPQIVIDIGMEVRGMEIIGSLIVVGGGERSIIWELPAGNCTFGTRWNIDHSIQTIVFEGKLKYHQISISPNLDYMVGIDICHSLAILNMYTGKELDTDQYGGFLRLPGFSLDGDNVWCATPSGSAFL